MASACTRSAPCSSAESSQGGAGGRDRADMSVDELIELGESKAENRELVVWLNGYMDPYEGEIDTAKYSRAEIVDKLLFD